MINSQQGSDGLGADDSISKGMGDQFSARGARATGGLQYIKGDG